MVPALVLAAGKSTRMGRTKPLLPIDDRDTFLTRIVRTFHSAGVDDVVVVLGHDAPAVIAALAAAALSPRIVVNDAFESGQLSSVLAGLNVIDRPGVEGMLLTLVDVPFVAASTVRAVLECYRATRAPVIRPVRGAEHGHPVLLDRSVFADLRRADPATGIKPIVRARASAAGDVPVDDDGAFLDIDTPAEYSRIVGAMP
jgi:molybdenum cofactor cytidylyltransferase